ncbi:MAG TPA: hypothetical protein VFZ57_05690 [Thermoanaerobaculia bacterium]|nr:hypothetical protein [Thermoanaerobaculia bacterium]
MPIRLASETPTVEHKGWRANYRWPLEQPWDELRFAAFQMTNHRRKSKDEDWTRRSSPFYAVLGGTSVECAVPVTSPDALPKLGAVLTAELKGIIAGASKIYDDILGKQGPG